MASSVSRRLTPRSGVLGDQVENWKTGMMARLGVKEAPERSMRCSSSPKMQPSDHMSIAEEYRPRLSTTSGAR